MSSPDRPLEKPMALSRRLLVTYNVNDEIIQKLKSKGFTLKSEIECLSDDSLQTMCGLTDEELETVNRVVRNCHRMPVEVRSIAQELADRHFIHTGSYTLNNCLGGGIQVGKISQMSAPGGAGKTQLCMQCCVNVQMPPERGGLSGEALYIDIEKNLRTDRLHQMAKHRLAVKPVTGLTVEKMISNIHIIDCQSAEELVNLVVDKLEPFIDHNPGIKLVVIDSIALLFRYGFNGSFTKRDSQLTQIAVKLKKIAHYKKVAVLVANQVTHRPESDEDEPALGSFWQTNCNVSFTFQKWTDSKRVGHMVRVSEPMIQVLDPEFRREPYMAKSFYFYVEETGIKETLDEGEWHPKYD